MNDNAKSWLAALRGDEFKQGRQMLKTEDGCYCCLGVACALAERAGIKNAWPYLSGINLNPLVTSRVPEEVAVWLGVRYEDVFAGLNDDGKTFAEIADYAEKEAAFHFVS